jgi:hypothetical protein
MIFQRRKNAMIKGLGVLIVVLALTACGGPAKDSPEGVVKRFFEQIEEQNETEVKNLVCQDFRQNVHFDLGKNQEARMKTDLKFSAEEAADESETVNVQVYGRIETVWETDHVRQETKTRRDEEAAWNVQLFKVDGDWLVCGGDPFIVRLLDVSAAVGGLEE